ncbi:MAG: sulfur oxidation c-type cytochrome SoxX, partial [Hyphomicrobiales bacterium]|nr:sulfur oxidation c-type cytochrome SoxX [Hyphomicrobiales bacterium]
SLTGVAGNADQGKELMVNRRKGNCLACHQISALEDQPFHGEVGPSLDGAAERWNEAQLRLILVNSKEVFDGTVMPAFYKSEGFFRVRKDHEGKTILTAQEVEDVLAYLQTFK